MGGVDLQNLDLVVRSMREVVELVYDTIREPTRIVSVPMALAKLLAMPRERLFRTVRGCPPRATRDTFPVGCATWTVL